MPNETLEQAPAITDEQAPVISERTQENLAKIGHEALRLTVAENLALLQSRPEMQNDEEAPSPSETAQSPRTHELTELISASLGDAYDSLKTERPNEVIMHDVLLERALELQKQNIVEKKSDQPAVEDLEGYLATLGIYLGELRYRDRLIALGGETSKEVQKVAFDEFIKSGRAEDLIEAARGCYGVLVNRNEAPTNYKEDGFDENIELSHLIDIATLEAGLGKRISLDPREPALTEMSDHEVDTAIKRLDFVQSARAAVVARQKMGRPFSEGSNASSRLRRATNHSLEALAEAMAPDYFDESNPLQHYGVGEIVENLKLISQADPGLSRQGSDEFFLHVKRSRDIAGNHNSDVDTNGALIFALDQIKEGDPSEYSETLKALAHRMEFDERTLEILKNRYDHSNILRNLDEFPDLDPAALDSLIKNSLRGSLGDMMDVYRALGKMPKEGVDYKQIVDRFTEHNMQEYLLGKMIAEPDIFPDGASKLTDGFKRVLQETSILKHIGSETTDNMVQLITEELAHHPDDLFEFATELDKKFAEIENSTHIFEIFGKNGPGYEFFDQIMSHLLKDQDNMVSAARALDATFSKDQSLWFISWQIANIKIGEVGEVGRQEGLKVSEIPIALPVPTLKNGSLLQQYEEIKPKKISEMSLEEKRFYLGLDEGYTDQQLQELTDVEFSLLPASVRATIFAHRLMEAVVLSRDVNHKKQAGERNGEIAAAQTWWHAGDLVHATSEPSSLRLILQNGALCGEAIGFGAEEDRYPMNLDTVDVQDEIMAMSTHQEKLSGLYNQNYGDICLVFRRGEGSLHSGEEFQGGMNEHHRLILGGLPSTEVSAIFLRNSPTKELIEKTKQAVVDNGQYIPIVDEGGRLVLSPEEYQTLRVDKNFDTVQVESRDSTFRRSNSQGGSNEGAEFLMGSERWYVKFAGEEPDHIWGEVLTDKLYKLVKPELVPETEPALIEGRLARASKMVEVDDTPVTPAARNAGFIVDCWLANWDAVYNADNLVMSGGVAKRIDNGNGLFFRARGERVAREDFGPEVREIEVGQDRSRLGLGMRQEYPGLSDEEVVAQVRDLAQRATDEAIDQLVDSVRLSKDDRDYLKQTLKDRRDYLVSKSVSLQGLR